MYDLLLHNIVHIWFVFLSLGSQLGCLTPSPLLEFIPSCHSVCQMDRLIHTFLKIIREYNLSEIPEQAVPLVCTSVHKVVSAWLPETDSSEKLVGAGNLGTWHGKCSLSVYAIYELDLVVMSNRGKRHAGCIKAEKCVPKTALEKENEKKK